MYALNQAIDFKSQHPCRQRAADLPDESFWHILSHSFHALGKVFLEVAHYENRQHTAINGNLILKVKGTFVNHPNVSLTALGGLKLTARVIVNRSAKLISQGKLRLTAKKIDNTQGLLQSKLGAVQLRCQKAINREGGIYSQAKFISCQMGAIGTFDTTEGILKAPQGILITLRPSDVPKATNRILLGEKAFFSASEGDIKIDADLFAYQHAFLEAQNLWLKAKEWNCSGSSLNMGGHSQLDIADLLLCDLANIDVKGRFTLSSGIWQHERGILSAALGIEAQVKVFNCAPEGLLSAAKGAIFLQTNGEASFGGIFKAAAGIKFLAPCGSLWMKKGRIYAPTSKVEIDAHQGSLGLFAAEIHGQDIFLRTKNALLLPKSYLEAKQDVTFTSETGLIDANAATINSRQGSLQISSKQGLVSLCKTKGSIGQNCVVESLICQIVESHLAGQNYVLFQGSRIRIDDSTFETFRGNLEFATSHSLLIEKGLAKAPKGCIKGSSEGWLSSVSSTHSGQALTFSAERLTLHRVEDEADLLSYIALATLSQTQSSCAAQHLSYRSQNDMYLQGNDMEATLIQAEAKGELTMLGNSLVGDVKLNSRKSQHLQRNQFHAGSIASSSGRDVHLHENQFINAKELSLVAKKGRIRLHGDKIQTNGDIKISAETVELCEEPIKAGDCAIQSTKEIKLSTCTVLLDGQLTLVTDGAASLELCQTRADQTSIQSKRILAEKSHLVARKHLQLKSQEIKTNHCQLSAEELRAVGDSLFTHSSLEGSLSLKAEGRAIAIQHSHLISEKALTILAEKTIVANSQVRAESINQIGERYTSISSQTVAKKSIQRLGKYIDHFEDKESADVCDEKAEETLISLSSKSKGSRSITASAKQMLLVYARQQAGQLNSYSQQFAGIHNIFQSSLWHARVGQIALYHTRIKTEAGKVQSQNDLAMVQCHLSGNYELQASQGSLDLSSTTVMGALDSHSNCHIMASGLRVDGTALQLRAAHQLLATGLFAQVKTLATNAKIVDCRQSFVKAKSIEQRAAEDLHASASQMYAESALLQHAGKILHLDHSKMGCGGAAVRYGEEAIWHRHAYSQGQSLHYQTEHLENSYSMQSGDMTICVSTCDNTYGRLEIGEGHSSIYASMLNNHMANFTGPGSLSITLLSKHNENAQVRIGGLFAETASQLTISGPVAAGSYKFCASHGNLLLNTPIIGLEGCFKAAKKIINRYSLDLKSNGSFTCSELDNRSSIHSHGTLTIDQESYQDPGDILAHHKLILISSGPIKLVRPFNMPGSMAFISRQGSFASHAPLVAGGDLTLFGQSLTINAPLTAYGRGFFNTPGMLHFNHTTSSIGNGMHADVGLFFNDVSNLAVHGPSSIVAGEFILNAQEAKSSPGKAFKRSSEKAAAMQLQRPSNFKHTGPLYLEVKNRLLNDASNFMVDGDLTLRVKEWQNSNRTHLHTYTVEVGRRAKKVCGFRYGSTVFIEERREIKIDGVANSQITGNLYIASEKMTNDGIFYVGGNAAGKIAALQNGIFDSLGRTPIAYALPHPTFSAHPFNPGGDIRVEGHIDLEVSDEFKNRGFIRAGGRLHVQRPQTFLNEKRITVESTRITRKNCFSRTSCSSVACDHLQPGGLMAGGHTELSMGHGINRGGEISTVGHGYLYAQEFSNEALPVRRFVDLNPGWIAPWQHVKKYSVATDFLPASILSGGSWTQVVEGRFRNVGSQVIGWENTTVIAGEIEQQTLFSAHKSTDRHSWNGSKKLYDIQMQEAAMYSIIGSMTLASTKGDIAIEGRVGSFSENAYIQSAGALFFNARTLSVNNHTSSWQLTPTSITSTDIDYNSTCSSRPELFSGKNMTLRAAHAIQGEGTQFVAGGNLDVKAQAISFSDHVVDHYYYVSGETYGLSFFGSEAIECAFNQGSGGASCKALLAEDPAVASVFKLAASQSGVERAFYALKTAVHTWKEAAKFSLAHQQGHLRDSLGEHFGLTYDGAFNPRITVRLGSFDQDAEWQSSIPTSFTVGGSMHVQADEQCYKGIEVALLGSGATLIGSRISFEAPTLRSKSSSLSTGLSLGVGGGGGLTVGVDAAGQSSKSVSHPSLVLDFGAGLKIQQVKQLSLKGVAIDADVIEVEAESTCIQSLVNTSSSRQWSAAIDTSLQISGSSSTSSSATVSRPAGLYARQTGILLGQKLTLEGAVLQNIEAKVAELQSKDVALKNNSEGYALSLDVSKLSKVGKEGLTWLGEMHMQRCQQKGAVRATVSGGNGQALGVNTEIERAIEMQPVKRMYVAVPLLAFNTSELRAEKQNIQKAWLHDKELSLPSPSHVAGLQTKPLTAQRVTTKPKHLKPTGSIELTSKKKSSAQPSDVAAQNSPAKLEIENFEHAISLTDQAFASQDSQTSFSPLALENMTLSPWGEKTFHEEEKEKWLDMMSNINGLATIGEALTYPYVKSAQWYCQSSEMAEINCHIASIGFKKALDYAAAMLPDNIVDWWQRRKKAIELRAEDNERRFDIPKEMTLQLYRDGEVILGNLALGSFSATCGRSFNIVNKATRVKRPHIEILAPTDLRGLHARDVTPLSCSKKVMPLVERKPSILPATVTSKAAPLSSKKIGTPSSMPSGALTVLDAQSIKLESKGLFRQCAASECAGKFIHDMINFENKPQVLDTILKKDLAVVQFHSLKPLGERTLNWFALPRQVNQWDTMDKVMDQLALLSNWGERSHVSLGRVPAGERLLALYGKAAPQINAATVETRPGGGLQIRIKGFKPEWIAETRPLPRSDGRRPGGDLPKTEATFRKITHISEFQKDLKKLSKKFRSLEKDIHTFVTDQLYPFHKQGVDNAGLFQISNLGFETPSVYKAKKVACKALKDMGSRNGIRVIYTYLPDQDEVLFLEIYHKGDKANENKERIKHVLKFNSNK